MMLSVVQFDPFALTPYYNEALCSALAEADCHVRYVTSTFLYDTRPHEVENYCIDTLYFQHLKHPSLLNHPLRRRVFKLLSYGVGHRAFLSSLKNDRPDIVHFQWSRFPLLDYRLIDQIQGLGVPVIHTIHDVEPLFFGAQPHRLARIYERVDAIVVHSEVNRNTLLAHYPQLVRKRMYVVPHILPALFTSEMTRIEARATLRIPQNVPVVLFFGSIRPYKSIETLIEAYILAQHSCGDLWIVVAGKPEYQRVRHLLQKLRPQAIIRLEYIPAHQVEMYHRAADIAVFPYQNISQSGALITAMRFGLPVVVTEVGGMPEMIDGNGWVIPPNDPEKLAEVLLEAIRTPTCLGKMGEQSARLIQERHNPKLVAQKMLQVYQAAAE